MPLLSRQNNKTNGGQPAQQSATRIGHRHVAAASVTSTQPRPAVCESPLFGTRRQISIGPAVAVNDIRHNLSSSTTRNRSGSTPNQHCSSSNLVQGNNSTNINSLSTNQSETPTSKNTTTQANESTLSSIPKHITRQQIHYAFSIMDTNSDGLIDLRDLSQMLANLGIPIDESILAHVLSGASKRGDRRMSEKEFLEWLGHFVQVSDEPADEGRPTTREDKSARSRLAQRLSGANWRRTRPVVRSSTATSSLVALGSEQQAPTEAALRKRRGSGSGLALMRSLSSSSSSGSSPSAQPSDKKAPDDTNDDNDEPQWPAASNAELDEARNDLRAAFCVFDLDGDGFITIDEVRAGLKLLGESWTPAELNQLFNRCTTPSRPAATLRANDVRQRINIDDFVQLLL